MVISTKYNLAVLGTGLSGTVVDLEGGIVTKMYMPSAFHDAKIHRNRESHFMRGLDLPTLKTPTFNSQVETSNGNDPAIPTLAMEEMKGDFRSHMEVLEANEGDDFVHLGQQTAAVLAELHKAKPERFRMDKQKSVLEMMIDQTEAFDENARDRKGFYTSLRRITKEAEATVKPVFCHGDFNYGNVMFEPETNNINGVIDFAFSGYGMPETDFLHLNVEKLLPEVIETYEEQTGRRFSEDRLRAVMLVNNMRGLVSTENMLKGDLDDECREYLEEDHRLCLQDIGALTESYGLQATASTGFVPRAYDRK